ncbi:homeobox KN domain protein [Ceratobasidium sp. AG-Ba]|nr:homeobox KN domain protein [Ceratobasidium sp. AG-Ba]
MDVCFDDTGLIQQLQSLEAQLLTAISAGADACFAFSVHLENILVHARQLVDTRRASPALTQVLSAVTQPLDTICTIFQRLEQEKINAMTRREEALHAVFATMNRRRRKRSTRSRKSKAGKNGQVRQSGKKSKRGRKSPVGNPKRRVQFEVDPNTSKANATHGSSRKCRTVTAPPTDSMKFGPCRDFFLNHLGDPYPTTVQKHQILKQSSPDFTLRSLNLWFVNIRRRSGWMNIFKKHAASKREAMRDLVARVEAQVTGRPAPNPLPSGATPPGFKVEQEIVDEIMAMRAVVDMVSREVYGEGWDQILQIKPWTEEEVRAHEERKKAARREARAAKADGDKKRKERDEHREQRKKDKESRKRVELEAVEGIRAARELHLQLMSGNKRKRDEDEDSDNNNNTAKRTKNGKEAQLDENGQPKKRKIKVPKVDEDGNPLTKEQRKALKKAMLAAQAQAVANPLKRKTPDVDPAFPGASDTMAISPKRRRRDAVMFDGFPAPGESTEEAGMPDLSQLFSMEWASPPASTVALPTDETPPPESSEFARPSSNLAAPAPIQTDVDAPIAGGERRFSQQLAAYALESGMFDNEGFGLFNAGDTFPGMAVDVNADALMTSADHASVSPARTESHTPIPAFTAPIQPPQDYGSFAPADVGSQSPATPYSAASTITPGGNADSEDMSWINAAIAQLPSEHDVQRQQHHEQYHHYGSQGGMYASGSSAPYHSPATVFPPTPEQRAPVSHQRTQGYPQSQSTMPPPPPPTTSPNQSRPPFPRPQARTSVPPPSFPQPQPPPQQRQRAPGTLWQTPYSHSAQQQQPQQPYQPAYSPQPTPRQPHSFPAPVQPQSSYDEQMYDHRAYTQPTPAQREHEYQTYTHPEPAPAQDPGMVLKQRELEFARAQEELQQRFKREQEEQLARFMQSQEDLRKQFLGSPAV